MSCTVYFSGAGQARDFEVLAGEGAAAMVNALRFLKARACVLDALRRHASMPVALDSGAYQGADDVAAYAAVVRELEDRVTWYANLDVVGDQEASDERLRQLEAEELRPLYVYQVRGGTSVDELRRRAGERGFVGIGGLVPFALRSVTLAGRLELDRCIEAVGEALQAEGGRAHFFGLGGYRVLRKYGAEHWFGSCDSSRWIASAARRRLYCLDGSFFQSQDLGLDLSVAECAAQNVRQTAGWIARPAERGGQLSIEFTTCSASPHASPKTTRGAKSASMA